MNKEAIQFPNDPGVAKIVRSNQLAEATSTGWRLLAAIPEEIVEHVSEEEACSIGHPGTPENNYNSVTCPHGYTEPHTHHPTRMRSLQSLAFLVAKDGAVHTAELEESLEKRQTEIWKRNSTINDLERKLNEATAALEVEKGEHETLEAAHKVLRDGANELRDEIRELNRRLDRFRTVLGSERYEEILGGKQ